MRFLMALVICAGGLLALDVAPSADAAPKGKATVAKKHQLAAKRRLRQRESVECARARQEDPAGEFARFPCWAREAFARGRRLID